MKYQVTYTAGHTRAITVGGILWVPGDPQIVDAVPDEVLAMAEFGGHFVIEEAKPTRRKKKVDTEAGAITPPDAPEDPPDTGA